MTHLIIKNTIFIYDNLHYEQFQDGTVKCIEDEIPFELPDGWEWTRIQNITQICLGLTHTPKYVESGIPFYSVKDISSGGLDTTNPKYISVAEFEKFPDGAKPQYGDILFGRVGTLGKPTIVNINSPFGIFVSLGFFRKYSHEITSKFLVHWMNSSLFWDQVNMNVKGAVLTNLNTSWLSKFLIPIPPSKEQARIVAQCEITIRYIEKIENTGIEVSNLITTAKSKILDLAIRGKLVPQDPTDEPASMLLERIREEKEELIKQGKIKRDKKKSVIFKGEDNSYYEKIGDEITCIDDEIPFEIPENWAFSRLKSIWELISGRDLSPSDYNDLEDGIPYITGASNFINGKISLVRWTPKPQVITNHGDLLITCKGTIGEIAINDFGKAHIARQIMAIRNIHNFNIDYLSLCLQFYIESIKQSAKGLIPGISREDVLNIILPVPPNKYQIEVVEAIQKYKEILNSIEANFN